MTTFGYHDLLHAEFAKETDRAAVIVAASMLDELLRSILVAKLVPVSSSTDELFDGANAPLGTFSARIEMAYRVGLISVKFSRDLHLVRRIRNDFAHNIHGWPRGMGLQVLCRSGERGWRWQGLTPRWSGRVKDKVRSSCVGVRAAQLNR
jgi:hypothetical protein